MFKISFIDFSNRVTIDSIILLFILIDIKYNQNRIMRYINNKIDNGGLEEKSLIKSLIPFK